MSERTSNYPDFDTFSNIRELLQRFNECYCLLLYFYTCYFKYVLLMVYLTLEQP